MRDLTEEELKLAPDWATHYQLDDDDNVIYKEDRFGGYEGSNDVNEVSKSFDINNYHSPLMHDSEQPFAHLSLVDGLRVDGLINKDWAIAIAKSLGVTADDLI